MIERVRPLDPSFIHAMGFRPRIKYDPRGGVWRVYWGPYIWPYTFNHMHQAIDAANEYYTRHLREIKQ